MTRKERSALQEYVNESLVIMGLEHWEVEVVDTPIEDPETDYAQIDPEDYSDIATLRLGPHFFEAPEPKQRRVIAHELAHLPSYRLAEFAVALKKFVPPDVWAVWHEEAEKKEDIMTEGLAKFFEKMLPKVPALARGKKGAR